MYVTSEKGGRRDSSPGWGSVAGVTTTWLIDPEAGGSTLGSVAVIDLEPGAAQPVHAHPGGEEGTIVIAGGGTFKGSDGSRQVGFGQALFAPAGSAHSIVAGPEGMKLLVVLGGGSGAEAGWSDGGSPADGGAVVLAGDEGEEMELDDAEQGFKGVTARWVIDSELGGSDRFVLGRSSFAPGGAHELHRHPGCAEFFYVLEGEGAHLEPDGSEVDAPLHTIGFMERGSWHGFRNHGAVPARSVFGYLGVGSFEDGGYELPVRTAAS